MGDDKSSYAADEAQPHRSEERSSQTLSMLVDQRSQIAVKSVAQLRTGDADTKRK